MKTPAREPAFHITALSLRLSAVIVATVIMAIVIAAVEVLPAVFPADVLAVNPMMPEARHVARDPNHFIVAVPIARAMAIEWPVANLD